MNIVPEIERLKDEIYERDCLLRLSAEREASMSAEVDYLCLELARRTAREAVLLGALAEAARNPERTAWAQTWLERADNAMSNVTAEDCAVTRLRHA